MYPVSTNPACFQLHLGGLVAPGQASDQAVRNLVGHCAHLGVEGTSEGTMSPSKSQDFNLPETQLFPVNIGASEIEPKKNSCRQFLERR